MLDQYGNEIVREKAAPTGLQSLGGGAGWYPLIREPYTGAWQRNVVEVDRKSVMAFHADFACKTLIARDIGKLRVKLVERAAGIWSETENAAYSPVLRKPNRFQTRNQFWEYWILSKLNRGNTYVLKQRDARQVVVVLYVLDPAAVRPLVAPDGSIYYELKTDNLAGIGEMVVVPASEIIHDRMNCLFHPLVGLPPVYASGLAATQGLNIQNNSASFFANNSSPGGVLTAPGTIDNVTAERFKKEWEEKFTGNNTGRVAVLGDGLKYEKMSLTAVEAQMIEQLKWSAEVVCSTYHVPPYKIGVGALPSFNNVQALNVEYYSQALQSLIEDAEECLDHGLGIGYANNSTFGTEFDIKNLLRMDSVTQMDVLDKAVKASVYSPNEARAEVDKGPVEGGNSPMAQQQNYSLAALAKRDAQADPFASATQPATQPLRPPKPADEDDDEIDDADNDNSDEALAAAAQLATWRLKSLLDSHAA